MKLWRNCYRCELKPFLGMRTEHCKGQGISLWRLLKKSITLLIHINTLFCYFTSIDDIDRLSAKWCINFNIISSDLELSSLLIELVEMRSEWDQKTRGTVRSDFVTSVQKSWYQHTSHYAFQICVMSVMTCEVHNHWHWLIDIDNRAMEEKRQMHAKLVVLETVTNEL